MEVTTYTTPREFLDAIEPTLSQREWQNTYALGVYALYCSPTPPVYLLKEPTKGEPEFKLLSTKDRNGNICLVAAQSPSRPNMGLFTGCDPSELPDLGAHIDAILTALGDKCPRSFGADERLCRPFADAAAARFGLKVVSGGNGVNGAVLTLATLSAAASTKPTLPETHEIRCIQFPRDDAHKDALTDMFVVMLDETQLLTVDRDASVKNTEDTATRGDLWAYMADGAPVVVAFCGRPTATGKSIQVVYTRPEFRRKGLAEKLVAELCRRSLQGDDGCKKLEYLALFSLDGEEGSSAARIYRRIGFGVGEGATYKHVNLKLER